MFAEFSQQFPNPPMPKVPKIKVSFLYTFKNTEIRSASQKQTFF